MQTACNLVTASAKGTNANISGKGSLWKVPSRAATSTIFPLKIFFAIKFPSPTAPVGHLLTPGDNVRKELALVNPNHVILSGWRKNIWFTLADYFRPTIFRSCTIKLLTDTYPATSWSSESLSAETAGSTWNKMLSWHFFLLLAKFFVVCMLFLSHTWPQCVAMPASS